MTTNTQHLQHLVDSGVSHRRFAQRDVWRTRCGSNGCARHRPPARAGGHLEHVLARRHAHPLEPPIEVPSRKAPEIRVMEERPVEWMVDASGWHPPTWSSAWREKVYRP